MGLCGHTVHRTSLKAAVARACACPTACIFHSVSRTLLQPGIFRLQVAAQDVGPDSAQFVVNEVLVTAQALAKLFPPTGCL